MNSKITGSHRPAILAIIESPSQKVYFQHDLADFDWHFFLFNPKLSLTSQVRGIVTHWRRSRIPLRGVFGITDEPSIVAALVAKQLKLPGNNPKAIYRAQHKALLTQYLSECTRSAPDTKLILSVHEIPPNITYPAFIRPAKGSLSMHSFKVNSKHDLITLLPKVFREERPLVVWSSQFYDTYAEKGDPPLQAFLIQPFLDYPQYTVDGYVYRNKTFILGITSSVYTPDRKSFDRFDFPADLPVLIQKKLHHVIKKLIKRLKYDNSGFNIEFFVTPEGEIIIIELNTRLSVQFVPLMYERLNHSNIYAMTVLSMGKKPNMRTVNSTKYVSSCVLRSRTDKYVLSVPSAKQIQLLIQQNYATNIRVLVSPGCCLSEYEQDSYSYRYAIVDISGESLPQILQKLKHVKTKLSFRMQRVRKNSR